MIVRDWQRLGYLFGAIPSLLVSVVTSILARLLNPASVRIWSAAIVGTLPYWLVATWVVGPQREFYSAELNAMITASAPIGGAVATVICTALTERFGSKRGLAEQAA